MKDGRREESTGQDGLLAGLWKGKQPHPGQASLDPCWMRLRLRKGDENQEEERWETMRRRWWSLDTKGDGGGERHAAAAGRSRPTRETPNHRGRRTGPRGARTALANFHLKSQA